MASNRPPSLLDRREAEASPAVKAKRRPFLTRRVRRGLWYVALDASEQGRKGPARREIAAAMKWLDAMKIKPPEVR